LKRPPIYIALLVILLATARGACGEDFDRGLFVSAIQDPQVLSSREAVKCLVEFASGARISTIYIQVHYANRSWFKSRIADSAPYEGCVKSLREDPVEFLIGQSHAAGIKVYAWLNLLSLGGNKDAPLLARYGPGILTRNINRKCSLEDYKIDGQFFLEPGDERVRGAALGIVEEAVSAYPELDGILLDYIRYPDKDPAYGHTESNVKRFKETTGFNSTDECDENWRKWKRDQVTGLLELASGRARELHPGIGVSATGCMPYIRAYYEAFQDWPSWLDRGIVDFVTVMSYSPYPDELERWLLHAKEKAPEFKKVRIGVGAYKLSGSCGIFRSELEISECSGAGGFAVFHYGSLLDDPALGDVLKEPCRAIEP
jgi:uncharacterized lipoprotein YddW (UPF0748 family)